MESVPQFYWIIGAILSLPWCSDVIIWQQIPVKVSILAGCHASFLRSVEEALFVGWGHTNKYYCNQERITSY
jgi:hypothetical protein